METAGESVHVREQERIGVRQPVPRIPGARGLILLDQITAARYQHYRATAKLTGHPNRRAIQHTDSVTGPYMRGTSLIGDFGSLQEPRRSLTGCARSTPEGSLLVLE
jgi:hypothetical protein